jgi:hypothetical protein
MEPASYGIITAAMTLFLSVVDLKLQLASSQLQSLLMKQIAGQHPEFLIQKVWDAPEFTFLTSFQVRPKLLV